MPFQRLDIYRPIPRSCAWPTSPPHRDRRAEVQACGPQPAAFSIGSNSLAYNVNPLSRLHLCCSSPRWLRSADLAGATRGLPSRSKQHLSDLSVQTPPCTPLNRPSTAMQLQYSKQKRAPSGDASSPPPVARSPTRHPETRGSLYAAFCNSIAVGHVVISFQTARMFHPRIRNVFITHSSSGARRRRRTACATSGKSRA